MAESFGGSVKLSGESEYKKALSQITNELKVMSSQMQIVTATYGKNDTSVEGLTAKNKVLSEQIEKQKDRVSTLKDALEKSKEQYGENSNKTLDWQTKLNKAEAELINMNNEVSENEKVMKESSEATKENSTKVDEFGKSTEDAKDKTLSLGDVIKANLISETIIGGIKALASSISSVAGTMKEAVVNGAGYADNILTTSTNTGIATKTLQEYNAVAELIDVSTETLTGSMAKNIKSMSSGKDSYAKLGVAVRDANGNLRDSETVYWESIDALGNIEDQTTRDALAMDIFGKSAQDLNSLIAIGSVGFNELAQEAHKMGAVLSDEGLEALGKLDDELQKSATISKSTGNILASAFAPAITTMLGGVNDVAGGFNNLIASILGGDEGTIEEATNEFIGYIESFITNISEQVPMMLEVATNLIDTLINTISLNLPMLIDTGLKVLIQLLYGITNNLGQILPVVIEVIMSIVTAIIQNLPTILEAGIQVLLSLIQGIATSLPQLIPVIVDAVITMVEAVLDNIDLIIDAGISIIFGLIDGLINAMPKLIDKIPEIIDKLIIAITNNLPKIIEAGITLIIKLAEGLIKAIPQLISKIPQIMTSLINGFTNYLSNMADVGLNLVKGIWNGINNATGWILDKIKGFGQSVLNGIKSFFGINSPSTLFKEEIGKNLALGVGEGFTNNMSNVVEDMQNALPTTLDTNVNAMLDNVKITPINSNDFSIENMIYSFKEALKGMSVIIDGDKMGEFVIDKVEKVVYT